jgi:Holliday junction resolvase RusA-like endonuclease
MKITLLDERPLSWNRFYSGLHWTQRQAEVERVRGMMVAELLNMDFSPPDEPVAIIVTAYFKNRPQDPDNICSKLYIDALIGRVLMDDSHAEISSVTTRSRVDRKKPRVEIEIRPTV